MRVVNDMPFNDILKITQMAVNRFKHCGLQRLGGGEYGNVYLYIDTNGKKYAIKVWNDRHINHDADIDFLLKLQGSEYFPKVYMYKRKGFLVMEFFEGRTLKEIYDPISREIADNTGKTRIKNIHNGIQHIEKAFRFAMSRGLLPFDTHGNNIVATPDGRLRFIDVGLFEELKVKYKILRWKNSVRLRSNKDFIRQVSRDLNYYNEFNKAKSAFEEAKKAIVEEATQAIIKERQRIC